MFLRTKITTSTNAYSQPINQLENEIAQADAIVIGAGSGLSTSAGLTYTGPRFENNFADFIDKYHYHDMYSASFYPYPSLEEYWAYWSRQILINRYTDEIGRVYADLYELVKDHDYFVLTTNVDHCFQKAGFAKDRLFYTQGDYGLWQCSTPCHAKTYDNEQTVRQMVSEQENMRIPSSLIPYCPVCGKPLTMNLRSDQTFVEDAGWHAAKHRYTDFLHKHKNKHVLYLELGVGINTPGIIKYPFWQMTNKNRHAIYASVNLTEATAPPELHKQAILIQADIGDVLTDLRQRRLKA